MATYSKRPRPGFSGSQRFVDFLQGLSEEEALSSPAPPNYDIKSGEVVDVGETDDIGVQLDDGPGVVRAIRRGFDEGWVVQEGDVVGVHEVDGRWLTMPWITRTDVDPDRIQFWIENRRTGSERLLAVSLYE